MKKTMSRSAARLIVLLLVIVMTAGMIPMMGSNEAYAEAEKQEDEFKLDDAVKEESDDPEITQEGAEVDPEKIPAEEVKLPVKSGKKKGAKLQSASDFPDADPAKAALIEADVDTDCEIDDENPVRQFLFTAEEAGQYYFQSYANEDTECRVLKYNPSTSSYSQVVYDDDGAADLQFKAGFTAEAGNVFILQAKYLNSGTGTFKVKVYKDNLTASIKITRNKTKTKAIIKASVTGDTFDCLCVDGDKVYDADDKVSGSTQFTYCTLVNDVTPKIQK